MDAITVIAAPRKGLKRIAQAGYIAKGIVYVLLGVIALMSALQLGKSSEANKTGVLQMVGENTGGKWLLLLLAVGLVCYSAWRMVEGYHQLSAHGKKRWKGLRYFFSAVLYFSLAVSAFRMGFSSSGGSGDNQQQLASEILQKPFGQWLLGIVAVIIAVIGLYQLYYAYSEKYKKHVQKMSLQSNASKALLLSGKMGYSARGLVWLLIAYLMMRAAISASSAQAGGTGKAMQLIQNGTFGTYILAFLAIGLIAYGVFNFVRARYEEFNQELR
jgi:hypothetical protein